MIDTRAQVEPGRYRFSAEEFRRLGEVGFFAPDARLELIESPSPTSPCSCLERNATRAGCPSRVDHPAGTTVAPRAFPDEPVDW